MRFKNPNISVCDLKNKSHCEITPFKSSTFSNMEDRNDVLGIESHMSLRSPRKKFNLKSEESSFSEESEVDQEKDNDDETSEIDGKEDDDWQPSSDSEFSIKSIGKKNRNNKENLVIKKVKVIGVKPEESDDETSETDEDSDDDQHSDSKFIKKKKTHLSDYEKMIERNRTERMAFLQSLKMDEVKVGLKEAVCTIQKKRVPVKRVYKTVEKLSPPVTRKSKRLANKNINLSEDALYIKSIKEAEAENIKTIPANYTFKEALGYDTLYESYIKDVNIKKREVQSKFIRYDNINNFFIGLTRFLTYPWKNYIFSNANQRRGGTLLSEFDIQSKFISYNKSTIEALTLNELNVAKVVPERITALAWYPTAENLIVSVGSKYGNLGIWNVLSGSNPYLLKLHLEGITNLQFNPFNHVQLVSSSYDGVLRNGDMVKHVFDEVYNVSTKTSCTWFDFLSCSTYLIAQKNGEIALVDDRSRRKSSEKMLTCHEYPIKTVNVHPTNKNFFVTSDNRGSIRLWDLRKIQKKPLVDITHHKRCVQSAFFSPVTGNSILATSADDTISIFDSTNLVEGIDLKQQMKHNNFTGRWLSVFRATWLPNSDDTFVIGSMQDPRRIQVYNKNMNIVCRIMDENLNSICSINAFHPFRPTLAGANSSGKVFVFTEF